MPSRGRGHGAGGDESTPRPRRAHGHVGSVEQGQGSASEVFEAGRVGGNRSAGVGGIDPGTHDLITQSTGAPGGVPDGPTTRTYPSDEQTTLRAKHLENSGAVALAGHGYRVQQNPPHDDVARARQATGDTGSPISRPDYLVEGRVFDCYSPEAGTTTRSIWSAARKKARKDQTQRVVLNLADWDGDMSALRRQFADWPIEKLKEVKAITPGGDIVQIDLPPKTD